MRPHCTDILTKKGTSVSEGSDLRVRQASEQRQQGREEEFIINEAIPTGPHQNPSKFTQPSLDTP